MISYLCDPGAHATVISRQTFNKINTPENPTFVHTYTGKPISSCNEKIGVLGLARIKSCKISSSITIKDVEVIVIETLINQECLMGRDLIARIPELANQVSNLRARVLAYTEDIISNAEHLREQMDTQLPKPNESVIIFQGQTLPAISNGIKNQKQA